ncbi:Protein FRA10AC1 [Halotydeus destructor]|nr:Protein FRA10AC1 [Halotydeus destructor]
MADYDSNFESDTETRNREKRRRDPEVTPSSSTKKAKSSAKGGFHLENSLEERRRQRRCFLNLDSYTRHKMLINEYRLCFPGATAGLVRDTSKDKTDIDVLRENHRFLWEEDDATDSWGKRLAKKYYDALFKEYGICDLSKYKENKIAMRWRTETEVIDGKGQFVCGEKRCSQRKHLRSWEVNFTYMEEGDKKNALVKMRLCPDCSHMLNHNSKKREAKRRRSKLKEKCGHDEDESETGAPLLSRDLEMLRPNDNDQDDMDYCMDNLLQ